MTSKTFPIWIVIDENGGCEVATDEDDAIDRLKNGSDEDLTGITCRVVKLNVTMAEPAGENGSDKVVDVEVPDDAGRIFVVETE